MTQGLTPLHYACYRDYLAAAKLLLVRGAKVDAVDHVGYFRSSLSRDFSSRYSALHLCAEHGNYSLIKLLLEVSEQFKEGNLLQYMAKVCYVDSGQKDAAERFPMRDSIDEPLRLAIRHGHFDCARLLLENGADPNVRLETGSVIYQVFQAKYFDGAEITQVRPTDVHFLQLLVGRFQSLFSFSNSMFSNFNSLFFIAASTWRRPKCLRSGWSDASHEGLSTSRERHPGNSSSSAGPRHFFPIVSSVTVQSGYQCQSHAQTRPSNSSALCCFVRLNYPCSLPDSS